MKVLDPGASFVKNVITFPIMLSYNICHFLCSTAILGHLLTAINGQGPAKHATNISPKKVKEGPPPKTPEVHLAKVDIQCGNNYNTFPLGKGRVCKAAITSIRIFTLTPRLTILLSSTACTNYGQWQYSCYEETCYVGTSKKTLASKELYFYDCARLGIEELLPRILAVRYKAANLNGAIEIMDAAGQEYACRWRKPADPANVRHAHAAKSIASSVPSILGEANCSIDRGYAQQRCTKMYTKANVSTYSFTSS
ncbi:hypothetical protein MJO28_005886 [Puccinia striiformis f. sp. tritici]|uniref:Uncharacterized protein n=3 Tax=Puccinia striiformis TaxID=27350 RepID=A0A0L0US98_9BASI|nr:hypothetical protein MJO28_005886 [Puccinia striiformis f. sp. tritici]KNE89860.1 hypothetical protein PSTG_16684 [Puccinia striiformis f. sp. tritici PST-78]POW06724.1 hypothetical protein PSHT_10247 [Puccinia striiformis]